MIATSRDLRNELENQVQHRTGRRIRNLAIELDPERIILRGHASTYYAKILAQEGVLEMLPDRRVENAIQVESTR